MLFVLTSDLYISNIDLYIKYNPYIIKEIHTHRCIVYLYTCIPIYLYTLLNFIYYIK